MTAQHRKAVRERKQHNAWKREMRRRFGPNWRTKVNYDLSNLIVTECIAPVPQLSPEELIRAMRAAERRVNPRPVQPAYIEGVSPNAGQVQQ